MFIKNKTIIDGQEVKKSIIAENKSNFFKRILVVVVFFIIGIILALVFKKEGEDSLYVTLGAALLIFIFLLMYPFLIMDSISMITNIGILLMMPLFYIIMIVEVIKKRETYRSFIFWIWIVLFFITYIVSLIKFIVFT